MCGEQQAKCLTARRVAGSSPRVRGTARTEIRRLQAERFIPACAGNRLCHLRLRQIWPVHPRVCGEQSKSPPQTSPGSGSSPRVRGTDTPSHTLPHPHRFIPACAGNSVDPVAGGATPTVHPRVCGEQVRARPCDPARAGSSPRVRGTAFLDLLDRDFPRFIPACAGNSQPNGIKVPSAPVHPRVCGEQGPTLCQTNAVVGSSPRVRGTGLLTTCVV